MELSDLYNTLGVASFGDTKENIDKLLDALREISVEHMHKSHRKADF